jgi:TetR/AcrR family hemagglutinin/protease transcriptional regulator
MNSIEVKAKRTRLTPHKRKQDLLEQSMRVFAMQGIGRCGHSEIAQAAGVSVATVFNYFQSREDLLDQVLQQVVLRFEHFIVDSIDERATARKNIDRISNGILKLVKSEQYWLHVWFEWSASARHDLGPLFVSSNNAVSQHLENMFERAMARGEVCDQHQASDLVNMLYALVYMLFTQANRNLSQRELKRVRNSVFDMLCIYQHAPNASRFVRF